MIKSTAVLVAIVAIFAGCDDPTTSGVANDNAPPKQLEEEAYVGTYAAVAGTTTANVEVTKTDFKAVVFTRPSAPSGMVTASVRNGTISSSADASSTTVWTVMVGDVDVTDSTVKITITDVERDGKTLSGTELAQYTGCSIRVTVTTANNFEDLMMTAIMDCLGATDPETVVDEEDPQELFVGRWELIDTWPPGLFRDGMEYNWDTETFPGVILTHGRDEEGRLVESSEYEYVLSPTAITSLTVTASKACWLDVGDDYVCRTLTDEGLQYDNRRLAETVLPIYYTVTDTELAMRFTVDSGSILGKYYYRFERVIE